MQARHVRSAAEGVAFFGCGDVEVAPVLRCELRDHSAAVDDVSFEDTEVGDD